MHVRLLVAVTAMLLVQELAGQSRFPLETVIQKGHELAVISVAISPDSNYIATGSRDRSVKVWSLKSGTEIRSFLGLPTSPHTVAFSSDGKNLLAAAYETLVVWEVETGKLIYQITTKERLTAAAFSPDQRFIVYGGYMDSVTVRSWPEGKIITQLTVNPDKGSGHGISIAMSADGKRIAFGETNRTFRVFDVTTWNEVYKFDYPDAWCGGCASFPAFSPDGRFLYGITTHIPVRKYDLETGQVVKEYPVELRDPESLAVNPDNSLLAVVEETIIRIWDSSTGTLVRELTAEPQSNFHKVTFTSRNELLIACDNNTAFIYNISENRNSIAFTGILNNRDRGGLDYDPNFYWESHIARYVRLKNTIMITPDGKSLIRGKFGTRVRQWDLASGGGIMEFSGHNKAVLSYDISKDGTRLLTGGGDGRVILWDVRTGDSLKVIRAHRELIFSVSFSHDEKMFACASWDGSMRLYDLENGKWIQYFDLNNNSAYNLAFHPNDLYLFVAKLDKTLLMIEPDTREVVRNFIGHTDVVSSIRINRNGTHLLTASWDGTVRIWDIATGLMTGHEGAVHTAIYSTDETLIYSAGADRVIRIWDAKTLRLIKSFEGHTAEITSLAINPEGSMLVSHSLDGVTKFWDLKNGREFFEHLHLNDRDWLVKTNEGYFNGTGDARKYVHFVSGLTTYNVDQFFEEFYRPDLLPKIFRERGGSGLDNIQGKIIESPPPGVDIAILPSENKSQATLYIKLTDQGNGVESLRILHNGKSIPTDKSRLTFPSGKGKSVTYTQPVNLVGGENQFTAIATNKSRIESTPGTVSIYSSIEDLKNTCYIVSVGINRYSNPRMNLNYARPDAESFLRTLSDSENSLFSKTELITLYDDNASREQILNTLDELSGKINAEDIFIFYYAGHGSMVDGNFFFIPSEATRLYDANSLNKDAIAASILQEKFRNIKALKQLIIMDACQSAGSVELLAQRGAVEEKAIAQLSRSAGIHVLASAGSEQFATEFAELGHGLFTYVLLQALSGEADGAPKDNKVTIYELKSYIDDQMPELTRKLKGKPQYPYTFSRGQDFPLILKSQ